MTWYGLRQQLEKSAIDGVIRPGRCLANFIAPRQVAPESIAASAYAARAAGQKSLKIDDYTGVVAVTAGLGAEKKEK